MRNGNALVFQFLSMMAAIGMLWLAFSVFAFLLPVILVFVLAVCAVRFWRIRQLQRAFMKNAEELFSGCGGSQRKAQGNGRNKPEIIDVEYEIINDDYKSNKSE